MSNAHGRGNPVGHDLPAELTLREQPIVSATEYAEILDGFLTPARPRFFVVELSELSRGTAPPIATHEGAPQPVSRDDLPFDDVRDVLTNISSNGPVFQASPALARLRSSGTARRLGLGKAFLLDTLDQQIQRAFDHGTQITTRDGVAEQVDRVLQFLSQLRRSVELNPIAGRRDRSITCFGAH